MEKDAEELRKDTNIILIGAQGSRKSTQAEKLSSAGARS
jgi:uncharacterized ferredoxin-like protein